MYDIKDFEIMAPVGSRESLAAAIQAGADSIYFGIESLNMRARSASTFTINDLREIAQICDEHGIKSYLTINTIIYDEDVKLMRTIVDAAKEAGISAVIAADVAVMSYCNEVGQEVASGGTESWGCKDTTDRAGVVDESRGESQEGWAPGRLEKHQDQIAHVLLCPSLSLWSFNTALCIFSFPCGSDGKESACHSGDLVQSPGWEDP